MKKITMLLLLMFGMMLTLHAGSFKLVDDELPKGHIFNKARVVVDKLSAGGFSDLQLYTRRAVDEDEELSDDEKAAIVKDVEGLEFKKNQFFYFTILYNAPFTKDETDIQFSLTDAAGNALLDDVKMFKIKQLVVSEYGSSVSYNYTYILVANTQVTKKVLGKSKLPVNLEVTFSGGRKRLYTMRVR